MHLLHKIFKKNMSTTIQQTLSRVHSAELLNSGLSSDESIAAGFFTVGEPALGKQLTGYHKTGLGITYRDPFGKKYRTSSGKDYLRLKPDWTESDRANADKELPKYLSPAGEGNRPYWAPTYTNWERAIQSRKIPFIWTEGEKKAACAGLLGHACIGFTGVYGWKDSTPRDNTEKTDDKGKLLASRAIPELHPLKDENIWHKRVVNICYDSDASQKLEVREAIEQSALWLDAMGAYPHLIALPTEIDGTKNGIDDFVMRYGAAAFDRLRKLAVPIKITRKNEVRIVSIPLEPDLQTKTEISTIVLSKDWAWHPGIGWHRWNGKYWSSGDDADVTRLDRDIYDLHIENKWRNQEGRVLNNIIRTLKATAVIEGDEWNPRHLIGFRNGVLNTATGEFAKHDRQQHLTFLLPFDYDLISTAPTWEKFLYTAVGGDEIAKIGNPAERDLAHQSALEAIALIQAFFRWAVEPKPRQKTDMEYCWDLYGEPGTGKGTILETLTNLIGEDNCGAIGMDQLKDGNALAALIDRPVTICSDEFGHISDPGTLNRIISNEKVKVKILYKDTKQARLNTFLIRAYNKILSTPAGSQGFDRRLIVMSFDHKPAQRDRNLQTKLNAELSGIFNWVWSLPLDEAKRRIATAGKVRLVKEASIARFEQNNAPFQFLREIFSNGDEKGVKPRDLYRCYTEWSREEGINPLSYRNFATEIERFGCYQRGKIMGFKLYVIPKMSEFDIIAHLGINVDSDSTNLPGNNSTNPEVNPLTFPANSPNSNPASKPIVDQIGEIGEKVEQEINLVPSRPTVNREIIQYIPERLEAEQVDGQITWVKITIDIQKIAKAWVDGIEGVLGGNCQMEKVMVGAKSKWQILAKGLSIDHLKQIYKTDFNRAPAFRRHSKRFG
jgi:putative DNA primase/helicase